MANSPPSYNGFKGALADKYFMQALVAANFSLYYWESAGKAEVDCVAQDKICFNKVCAVFIKLLKYN